MKIEQRIGRVDRIGQKHIVRALNFALADTVELRVREVLEEKLARILEEFGVDKLADVLDSEEGGVPFEELFAQAIIAPEDAEQRAAALPTRSGGGPRKRAQVPVCLTPPKSLTHPPHRRSRTTKCHIGPKG